MYTVINETTGQKAQFDNLEYAVQHMNILVDFATEEFLKEDNTTSSKQYKFTLFNGDGKEIRTLTITK